jgi:hypothetical protein
MCQRRERKDGIEGNEGREVTKEVKERRSGRTTGRRTSGRDDGSEEWQRRWGREVGGTGRKTVNVMEEGNDSITGGCDER